MLPAAERLTIFEVQLMKKISYQYKNVIGITITDYSIFASRFDNNSLNAMASSSSIGAGVDMYTLLLNSVPVASTTDSEYASVHAWIVGARVVNAGIGVFSEYIRNYTQNQYNQKYGTSGSIASELNKTSNLVAATFGREVLESLGQLPSLETLGFVDGGQAASQLFTDAALYPSGDYTSWSGTILFSYLGYDDFYKNWLLTTDAVSASIVKPNGLIQTATVKQYEGTYDLLSAVSAHIKTVNGMSLQSKALMATAKLSVQDNDQNDLILATEKFITDTYGLPSGHPFAIGAVLPYSSAMSWINSTTGVLVGSYRDDSPSTFQPLPSVPSSFQNYIIHAGLGNDIIDANINGLRLSSRTYSLLVDGGVGTDTLSYKAVNSELHLTFAEISEGNLYDRSALFIIEKHNVGGAIYAKDHAYSVEKIIGSNYSDILSIDSLTATPTGAGERNYRVDLGGRGALGNTLDLSSQTANFTMSLWGTDMATYRGIPAKDFEKWGFAGEDVWIPLPGTRHSLFIDNVDNFLFGSGNDNVYGNIGANILSGGGGTNQLWGRGGADIFVVGRSTTTIKDADADDRLYIPFSTINPSTAKGGMALELKGGLVLLAAPAQVGKEVDLKYSASFYPSVQDGKSYPIGGPPIPGRAVLSHSLESQIYVNYSLEGNDLNISVMTGGADSSLYKIIVEGYSPGDLGLDFHEYFIPDITRANMVAAKLQYPGYDDPMDGIIFDYHQASLDLVSTKNIPYFDGVWYG